MANSGDVVYNSDNKQLEVYDGSAWSTPSSTTAIRYVKASGGSDSADGTSWQSAFATIDAASDALGANPGVIYLGPGTHTPADTLPLKGRRYIGATAFTGGGGYAQVNHAFDGDLFEAEGEQGGGIEGVSLVNNGSNTGAAIRITSTVGATAGYFYFDKLIFTGTTGFANNVVLNGSANSIGIRSVFFRDCLFFGASSGINVNVNRGIHVYFTACDIIQAPATGVTQYLQIQHAASEDVFFSGKVLGNIETAGAASGGGDVALMFTGSVLGDVAFATGSAKNVILGSMSGTMSNSGSLTSNRVTTPWITATLQNSWAVQSSNTPKYRLTADGTVEIKGAVTKAVGAATDVIFTLPTHLRPFGNKRYAVNSNAAFASLQITASTGAVALTGGGSNNNIFLDGISFPCGD